MSKKDKALLIHFINHPLMYIKVVDENNIIAFIHGYEAGRRGKCDFTALIKVFFSETLYTNSSSDGWSGQISRYSTETKIDWAVAFKQSAIKILESASV